MALNQHSYGLALFILAIAAMLHGILCNDDGVDGNTPQENSTYANLCEQIKAGRAKILILSDVHIKGKFLVLTTNYQGYEVDLSKFYTPYYGKAALDLSNATLAKVVDSKVLEIKPSDNGNGVYVVNTKTSAYIRLPNATYDSYERILSFEKLWKNDTDLVALIPVAKHNSETKKLHYTTVMFSFTSAYELDESNFERLPMVYRMSHSGQIDPVLFTGNNFGDETNRKYIEVNLLSGSEHIENVKDLKISGGFYYMDQKALYAVSTEKKVIYIFNMIPGQHKPDEPLKLAGTETFENFFLCDSYDYERRKDIHGSLTKTIIIILVVVVIAAMALAAIVHMVKKKGKTKMKSVVESTSSSIKKATNTVKSTMKSGISKTAATSIRK